jgi:predicted ester cyclase
MSTTTEANKDLLRRLLAEVDRGADDLEAYYSPDYVDHAPTSVRRQAGRDGLRGTFAALRRAFPDTRHTIEDLFAEGDRVVARVSARATHTGELFGHAPTGRIVSLTSITIYRVVDGRIAERWSEHGQGLFEQIGIVVPEAH